MAKTNAMPIPSEDDEQRALASWLDLAGLAWLHVPNGGHRHVLVGLRLKRLGAKAGAPDVLIFSRCPAQPELRGVAIELKRRDGGRLSDAQKAWISRLNSEGWCAFVAHGATDAIRKLEALGFNLRKR